MNTSILNESSLSSRMASVLGPWTHFMSETPERQRAIYAFIKFTRKSKTLWQSARWHATFSGKLLDSQSIEESLFNFKNFLSPDVDAEVVKIFDSLILDECVVNDEDLLHLLSKKLRESRLPNIPDPKSVSEYAPRSNKENYNTQTELAMLWNVLNSMIIGDDGDSVTPITLFFQEFLPELSNYPSLSLSTIWAYVKYPGSSVSYTGTFDEPEGSYLALTAEEELNNLMSLSRPDFSSLMSGVSRCHDPLNVVLNLFNLSESQIAICLFEREEVSNSSNRIECIETLVSVCLALAVKSARLSLILRALCLIQVTIQCLSPNNHESVSGNEQIGFISIQKSFVAKLILDFNKVKEAMKTFNISKPSSRYMVEKRAINNKMIDSVLMHIRNQGGLVLTFGKAEHGKLGHGDTQQNRLVPTIVTTLEFSNIVKIASMSTYTLALDEAGSVYIWGSGGSIGSLNGSRRDVIPKLLDAIPYPKSRIIDISCGLGHSLFLTDTGSVFAWGNGANGRLGLGDTSDHTEACRVSGLGSEVVTAVQCGSSFSLVLTRSGSVYSWGKNNQGQCGVGHTEDVLRPRLIRSLPFNYHTIIQLAAGWEHSLALASDGKLFSWGCGYKDSRRTVVPPVLGLGHNESRHSPNEIVSLDGVFVVQVASGWDHCLALDKHGKVLSWGSGQNGKLGQGTDENFSVPCFVAALEGIKVAYVTAGCEHSAAITDDGYLYTWGHGDGGRLGHGDNSPCLVPTKVQTLIDMKLTPKNVHCGDKFTSVIAACADSTPLEPLKSAESLQPIIIESESSGLDIIEEITENGESCLDLIQCFDLFLTLTSESSMLATVQELALQGSEPYAFDVPFSRECSATSVSLLAHLIVLFGNRLASYFDLSSEEQSVQQSVFVSVCSSLSKLLSLCNGCLDSLSSYKLVSDRNARDNVNVLASPITNSKDTNHATPKPAAFMSSSIPASPDEEDADELFDQYNEHDRDDDATKSQAYASRGGRSDFSDERDSHDQYFNESYSPSPYSQRRRDPDDQSADDRISPAPSYESLNHSIASEMASGFDLSAKQPEGKLIEEQAKESSDELMDAVFQQALFASMSDEPSPSPEFMYSQYQRALESSSKIVFSKLRNTLSSLTCRCYDYINQSNVPEENIQQTIEIWKQLQRAIGNNADLLYSMDESASSLVSATRAPLSCPLLPAIVQGVCGNVNRLQKVLELACDSTLKKFLSSSPSLSVDGVSVEDVLNLLKNIQPSIGKVATLHEEMLRSAISLIRVWLSIPLCNLKSAVESGRLGAEDGPRDIDALLGQIAIAVDADLDSVLSRCSEISDGCSFDSIFEMSITSQAMPLFSHLPQISSTSKSNHNSKIGRYHEIIFKHALSLCQSFKRYCVKSSKNVGVFLGWMETQFRHVFRYLGSFVDALLDCSCNILSSEFILSLVQESRGSPDDEKSVPNNFFAATAVLNALLDMLLLSPISIEYFASCLARPDLLSSYSSKQLSHSLDSIIANVYRSTLNTREQQTKSRPLFFVNTPFLTAFFSDERAIESVDLPLLSNILSCYHHIIVMICETGSYGCALDFSIFNSLIKSLASNCEGYISCHDMDKKLLAINVRFISEIFVLVDEIEEDSYSLFSMEVLRLLEILQSNIEHFCCRYQTFFDSLSTNSASGQLLTQNLISVEENSPLIASNVATATGDYTLAFWLWIPSELSLRRPLRKPSSELPLSDGPEVAPGIERIHLLSRVPETGDFNLSLLFDFKFPCHCNPSIFLCVEGDRFYISVFVTLPNTPSKSASNGASKSRRIHLQSTDLNPDKWIHCSFSLAQDKVNSVPSIDPPSPHENLLSIDKRPQQQQVQVNDILKAKLYINGKLDQVLDTPSTSGRHHLHQNIVFGTIPVISDNLRNFQGFSTSRDSFAGKVILSDVHWFASRDAVSFTMPSPSNDDDRIPPVLYISFARSVQDQVRQLLVSLSKSLIKGGPAIDLIVSFAEICCRVALTGNEDMQLAAFEALKLCVAACNSSSVNVTSIQPVLTYLISAADQMFRDDSPMSFSSNTTVDRSRLPSVSVAKKLWSSRCSNVKLIQQVFKQSAQVASCLFLPVDFPMLFLDENIFVRGLGILLSTAFESDFVDEYFKENSFAQVQLANVPTLQLSSFLADVCMGGWFPFTVFADRVLLPSKGLTCLYNISEDEQDIDKNIRNVEDCVLFRAIADVYNVTSSRNGIWLHNSDGFFTCNSDQAYLPKTDLFILSSEMLAVEDKLPLLSFGKVEKALKLSSSSNVLDGVKFVSLLRSLISSKPSSMNPQGTNSTSPAAAFPMSTKYKAITADNYSDSLRLLSCMMRLRSYAVQLEASHLKSENRISLPKLLETIGAEISSIVQLAVQNPEELISTIFESANLKPSQLEVLKSLLRENDVNFLEKICLRQWKCFQGRRYRDTLQDSIQIIAGEINIMDGRIRAQAHFPTFRLREASLQRMTGRWFYECTLLTDGLMQIGYANNLFRCDPVCGQGVGDHFHSWAYDGLRNKKWNVSCEPYGKRWKVGDVVGVLMDMDLLELRYYLNGEDLGPAFTNFSSNDIFPAVSLNVRQSIRFNYGQDKFVYPPDEVDGKPYKAIKLAALLKRSASKIKIMRSMSDSKDVNPEKSQSDSAPPSSRLEFRRSSNSDAQQRELGISGISAAYRNRLNDREGEESDGVDDSEVEVDDEDNDDDEVRWRAGRDYIDQERSEDQGEGLAVIGESLGNSSNERSGRLLELRREALIENLIGMGFPVDWAVRAAEHSDSTASEAAAISWIIERMELEQNRMDDGETSSRAGEEEDFDEGDDAAGLEFLMHRNVDSRTNNIVGSENRRSVMAGFQSNSSRMEITIPSESAQSAVGALGSPGSAVREEVSTLRRRVNGILQGIGLQIETPKSVNQSNDIGKNAPGALESKPVDRIGIREVVAAFEPFSAMLPAKVLAKHHHDKEKQDVLGQISDLDSSDLFPIVCCCQAALNIYYARLVLSKIFLLLGSKDPEIKNAVLSSLVSVSPSSLSLLLPVLFKQFLPSASAADHYFFSDIDKPAFEPFVSTASVSLLKKLQSLFKLSSVNTLSSIAVDDSACGPQAIERIIDFGALLMTYNCANLDKSFLRDIVYEQLEVPCSAALSVLTEQCLQTFDKTLMGNATDHRNWAQVSTTVSNAEKPDPNNSSSDLFEDRRHGCVLWAYITLKRILISDELKKIDIMQSDSTLDIVSSKTLGRLLKVSIHSSNPSVKVFVDDLSAEILTFISEQLTHSTSEERYQLLYSFALEIFTSAVACREVYHAFCTRFRAESLRNTIFSQASQAMNRFVVHLHNLGDLLNARTHHKENLVHQYIVQDWQQEILSGDDSLTQWVRVTQKSSNSITVAWNFRSGSDGSLTSSKWMLRISRCSSGGQRDLEEAVPVSDDLQESGGFRIDDLLPDTLFRITFVRLNPLLSSKTGQPTATFQQSHDSAKHSSNQSSSISLFAATESEPMFVFDTEYMSPLLVVGSNQLSLRNTSNKKWSTARINSPMESGLHRWEVQIDRCVSKNIFIGVCTVDAKYDNYCGCDKFGWAFLANKAIWHNKTKLKSYGELFKTGDIITLTLDLDAGTLSFSLNGLDLGQAVIFETPLPGPLFPAFSLYNEDDQISILPPRQIGEDLVWRTSSIERLVNRQQVLFQLLRSLDPLCPVLQASGAYMLAVEELKLRWDLWSAVDSPCSIRSLLVAGEIVPVIDSLPFCLSFSFGKLHPRDMVLTESSKQGRVLGVARHKLWISFDGDNDLVIGYTQDNLAQAMSKGSLQLLRRESPHSTFANDLEWRRTFDASEAESVGFASSSTALMHALSKLGKSWTSEEDFALAQFLDFLALQLAVHPSQLPLSTLISSLNQFEEATTSIAKALRLFLTPSVVKSVCALYRNHPDEEIYLRALVIIHTNDVLEPLLPIILPSMGVHSDSLTLLPEQVMHSKNILFQTTKLNFQRSITRSALSQQTCHKPSQQLNSPLMQFLQPANVIAKVSPTGGGVQTLFPPTLIIEEPKKQTESSQRYSLYVDADDGYADSASDSKKMISPGQEIYSEPSVPQQVNSVLKVTDLSTWTITVCDSNIFHAQLTSSAGMGDADFSSALRLVNDEGSAVAPWQMLLAIQASYVGQTYSNLQRIHQAWQEQTLGVNIEALENPPSGTQESNWEDALRAHILQNCSYYRSAARSKQPPFSVRKARENIFFSDAASGSFVISLLDILPASLETVSHWAVFSCLLQESLLQVEALIGDVELLDELGVKDSMSGLIDLTTQYMHMIGVIIGLALSCDVAINLRMPKRILSVLGGEGVNIEANGKSLLVDTCALCLRHGISALIPEPALQLWSVEDWTSRLQGWTRGFGFSASPSIRHSAVYVEGVDPSAESFFFFWAAMRELSGQQTVSLMTALGNSLESPVSLSLRTQNDGIPSDVIDDFKIVEVSGRVTLLVPQFTSVYLTVTKLQAFADSLRNPHS